MKCITQTNGRLKSAVSHALQVESVRTRSIETRVPAALLALRSDPRSHEGCRDTQNTLGLNRNDDITHLNSEATRSTNLSRTGEKRSLRPIIGLSEA